MTLTNKQRAFVEHYLATGNTQWNATEAAKLAGYKGDRNALAVVGSRNLRKAKVQEHIRRRLEEMGATTNELIQRWLHRIRADISPFVTNAGLDVDKLKRAGLGFLVKGVRQTKDATTILLRDPDKAEEMLARHLGTFAAEKYEIRHEFRDISDTELDRQIAEAIASAIEEPSDREEVQMEPPGEASSD